MFTEKQKDFIASLSKQYNVTFVGKDQDDLKAFIAILCAVKKHNNERNQFKNKFDLFNIRVEDNSEQVSAIEDSLVLTISNNVFTKEELLSYPDYKLTKHQTEFYFNMIEYFMLNRETLVNCAPLFTLLACAYKFNRAQTFHNIWPCEIEPGVYEFRLVTRQVYRELLKYGYETEGDNLNIISQRNGQVATRGQWLQIQNIQECADVPDYKGNHVDDAERYIQDHIRLLLRSSNNHNKRRDIA